MKNRHIIIVGDWNLLLDPCVDGRNYQHINNKKAKDSVRNLIAELDLFDIWRSENPELTKITWRRTLANKELEMGRLYVFLISVSLASYTTNQTIELGYRSDHSTITLSLAFIETPNAKTFWEFNNSLLRDKEYINIIKNTIGEVIRQYAATPYNPESVDTIPGEIYCSTINPALFWEMLLLEIRQKSILTASALKKEHNSETREVEEEVETLSENNQESSEEFIMKKEQFNNLKISEPKPWREC